MTQTPGSTAFRALRSTPSGEFPDPKSGWAPHVPMKTTLLTNETPPPMYDPAHIAVPGSPKADRARELVLISGAGGALPGV
ncbi:hypothetical protein EVAR_63758_1 [Eumeta japonica]|uniref:Uncharacterized protein n=1 Tax=Eumeta variegata TaxID=151549 RepID=A0A4C1ZM16_EUMVA|nr:hypothetical protein EVAR_63758_1 [Eumeta japonica]